MLTKAEIGPFMTIIPLVGTLVCLIGVISTRNCPILAATLIAWFISVQLIAQNIPFHDGLEWSDNITDDVQGVILLIILMLAPLAIFYLLYLKLSSVRKYMLHEVAISNLIQFNLYRLVGGSIVYLYWTGVSKNYAMLHGGVCDIIIGLTAIPLAQHITDRGLKNCRGIIMAWNFFGVVVDFSVTTLLVLINFLGIFQPQYSLAILVCYPMSTILLFNVPLAAIMHILMMTKFDIMAETYQPILEEDMMQSQDCSTN